MTFVLFCWRNLVKPWFGVCLEFPAWAALMSFRHCGFSSVLTAVWPEHGRRHILARVRTVFGWTRCDAQATSWRWSSVPKVLGGNTTASTLRMQECRAVHFQVVFQAPCLRLRNPLQVANPDFLHQSFFLSFFSSVQIQITSYRGSRYLWQVDIYSSSTQGKRTHYCITTIRKSQGFFS